ncbi:hypothetical protein BH20ACT15_BH20ACT15_08610 [soil metagenome]
MIQLGLLLALACALLSNVALLCKHRGAMRAPDVRFARPWQSTKALFASRWWTIGFAVAFLAIISTENVASDSTYSGSAMAAFEGGAIVIGVALKALADAVPADALAIVSPWTVVAALAAVGAFFALARSLQIGDAIGVIVVSSVAANAAAIVGGVLVFGDPLGSDALAIAARGAAFAAVITAAALIPAAPQEPTQRLQYSV